MATTTRKLQVWTVDAFSASSFGGNPASVCIIDYYNVPLCKLIAREMKHAETAFVIPHQSHNTNNKTNSNVLSQCNRYDIRWWTPIGKEINMCGHATLAAAHVLYNEGYAPKNTPIIFNCIKEQTTMNVSIPNNPNQTKNTNNKTLYLMNFPKIEFHYLSKQDKLSKIISNALGNLSLNNDIINVIKGDNGKYLMIHINFDVTTIKPNLELIKSLPFRCCIVTCDSQVCKDNSLKKHDFVSRVFGPAIGVPEDNVSGNAHRLLCIYWSELKNKCDEWISAYQASLRTGHLMLKYLKNNEQRVLVSGYATTVLTGFINLGNPNNTQISSKL